MSYTEKPEEAFGIDARVWSKVFGSRADLGSEKDRPKLFLLAASLSPEMLSDYDEIEPPASVTQAIALAQESGFEDPEGRIKRCLQSLVYWIGNGYVAMDRLRVIDHRLTSWCAGHIAINAVEMIQDKRRFGQEISAASMTVDLFRTESPKTTIIESNATMLYNTSQRRLNSVGELYTLPGYACLSAYHALMTDVERRRGEWLGISGPESVFFFERAYAAKKGNALNPLFMNEANEKAAQIIADAIWTYPLPSGASGSVSRAAPLLLLASWAAIGAAGVAAIARR